ncbi:hypothetical protein PTKU46_83210 [Paraburkholderia terrae]
MTTSSFEMSDFRPVEGKIIVTAVVPIKFTFSSAYNTSINIELSSENDHGAIYKESRDTTTDGTNDSSITFSDNPDDVNLLYRITVKGEVGSKNVVFVYIDS